jgi:hypothetical protein
MIGDKKIPKVKLTVVIRDESPFLHLQEPVTHRSVVIWLTEGQLDQLALHCTGRIGGSDLFESLSQCFLESTE